MKRLRTVLMATVAVLAVSAGTAVLAAPPNGMGDCGMGPGMAQGGRWQHGGDATAFAEKRLAAFKTELKITAQQEPAWQAFADQATQRAKAMQAARQQMHAAPEPAGAAKPSAPERMAQHLEQMKQHLADMETMQGAVKNLYAVLTPEQRTLADQHFERMHRGGPMGHRRPKG